MLHGDNNAHDTSACKSLMAQAEKLKGNETNQKGKGSNKTWKNKAKDETGVSKKELVTSVKKATQLIEQGKLKAIKPVKKRKVKWPSKDQELCALDAQLKNFNCKDLSQMDIAKSDEAMNDGELDLSMSDEVSNEVSV